MSGYKSFAIAGASGTVGKHLLEAIEQSKYGFRVTILTRKSVVNDSFAQEWKNKGAKVAAVDYGVEEEVVTALSGVDVVISTLGGPAFGIQVPLVKAAKKAGVKLFVNSHWGSPLNGTENPGLAGMTVRTEPPRAAEEVGLPWAEFSTGTFPEYCLPLPWFGMAGLKDGKATVYGDGEAQNSWTTQADVARYVLYVLTQLPPSKFENRRFNIQGDAKSFNEIIGLYEGKHPGPPVDVTYKPLSELEELVAKKEGRVPIINAILLAIVTGHAKHNQSTLDNGEYPDWNPKGVVDVL